MIRTLLILACVVVVLVVLWAMRLGWRHRAERQADLSDLPAVPDKLGAALLPPMTGLYVGTSTTHSWQDRVVAHGLGTRADATVRLHDKGVVIERQGADTVFIPRRAVREVRLAPGLAGKVVGAGGLIVFRWELGQDQLDTGVRADDRSLYPKWIEETKGWVAQ